MMDLKERLRSAAALEDKKTPSTIRETTPHPSENLHDTSELRLRREVEKLKKERELLLKRANHTTVSYKQITVKLDKDDYDAFKEGILDKVERIRGPVRENIIHSHNPWLRAAFSCIMARLDQVDIETIESEEDIHRIVDSFFKPLDRYC